MMNFKIICLLFGALAAPVVAVADNDGPVALKRAAMIEFHEAITPLSGALLKRRFEQVVADGAKIIVLDIDSPGGYLSTTLELVDMIEAATDVHTVAYIQREAISGAAILALAADEIIVAPRALIGDAGLIMMGEDAAFRYAPEKERSYLAQRVRTIAEKAGRPPSLAEAMVDKDLVVFKATHKTDDRTEFFSEKEWKSMDDTASWDRGKPVREAGDSTFFTATGSRAVELGMANQVVENPAALAGAIGAIDPIPVIRGTWVDTLILFLNWPLVTGFLLMVGLVALVVEFSSPGVGIGALLSIFCFGLFFWSRFLGGTAGWFEVILFVIGVTFVMLVILVITGVGGAGVGGGGLMLFALVMASRRVFLPESLRDSESLMIDVLTILGSLVGFIVALFFMAKYLGELPLISRLALAPPTTDVLPTGISLAASSGDVQIDIDSIQVGDFGQAAGALRPSGRVRFGELLVDVVSEGDFVESETTVKVILRQGSRVVVRAV